MKMYLIYFNAMAVSMDNDDGYFYTMTACTVPIVTARKKDVVN